MTKTEEGNAHWVGNQKHDTSTLQTLKENRISTGDNQELPTILALSSGLGLWPGALSNRAQA